MNERANEADETNEMDEANAFYVAINDIYSYMHELTQI